MVKQTLHMRFQSRKFLTVTEMWYRCVSGDIFCNVLVISHKIHKEQLVSHVLLDNTKIPSWTKQPLKNKKYFRFNTSVFRKQDCQCKHHVFQATQYISGVFYMKAGKSTLQPYKTAAFELTGSHPAEVRLLVPKKKKKWKGVPKKCLDRLATCTGGCLQCTWTGLLPCQYSTPSPENRKKNAHIISSSFLFSLFFSA